MDPVEPESIAAAGNAVLGMGNAISGLVQAGLILEAKDLTTQMLYMSKSIGFLLRTDRSELKARSRPPEEVKAPR